MPRLTRALVCMVLLTHVPNCCSAIDHPFYDVVFFSAADDGGKGRRNRHMGNANLVLLVLCKTSNEEPLSPITLRGSRMRLGAPCRILSTGACLGWPRGYAAFFANDWPVQRAKAVTLFLALQAWHTGMDPIGCTSNVCVVHQERSAEKHRGRIWTPAMASGLTDHMWSLRALLSDTIASAPRVQPKRQGSRPERTKQQCSFSLVRLFLRLRLGAFCPTTVSRGFTPPGYEPEALSPYPTIWMRGRRAIFC